MFSEYTFAAYPDKPLCFWDLFNRM